MNFEIQKKKLDEVMYSYIVDLFENNELGELNYTYFDDHGAERDWQITFYFGDYGDDNIAFTWETKEIYEYWDGMSPSNRCPQCPRVIVDESVESNLNGLFNDMWKPMFKKWLKENYGLEPKTII